MYGENLATNVGMFGDPASTLDQREGYRGQIVTPRKEVLYSSRIPTHSLSIFRLPGLTLGETPSHFSYTQKTSTTELSQGLGNSDSK